MLFKHSWLLLWRGKRWDETLEKPDLDYSEIFDELVGQIEGQFSLLYFISILNYSEHSYQNCALENYFF